MNKGYPEEKDLKLIREWDHNDIFNLLEYLYDCWHFQDWGFKQKWSNEIIHQKPVLFVELHTGGWSGNESLITALLQNKFIRAFWYKQWTRGGHYKFEINPYNIGYTTVLEYCKNSNVSRQYVYKIKDRFKWVIISKNKRLLKKWTLIGK